MPIKNVGAIEPAPSNDNVRYGFVQKFIIDRAFGFIRCVGEGREAPTSELDYNSVKHLKKGSEEEGRWQDVYFKKRNVVTDSGKTDFFKRKGTPVKFILTTFADNRTEAQTVQFFDIGAQKDNCSTTPGDMKAECGPTQTMGASSSHEAEETVKELTKVESNADSTAKPTCDYANSTPSLIKELQDYHNEKEEEIFFNQLFDCMVCFATKPGAKSIRFPGTFTCRCFQLLLMHF